MGYTHYFDVKRDTEPALLVEAGQAMAHVVTEAHTPLAGPDGEGLPEIDEDKGIVRFNGALEDSHESFIWPPNLREKQDYLDDKTVVFNFCKTAFKPYDPVVVCCLLCAQKVLDDKIAISTDGDEQEFFGTKLSEGWQQVNALLNSPTEAEKGREGAWNLYKRVFGEEPPIPPCIVEHMVAKLTDRRAEEAEALRERAVALDLKGTDIRYAIDRIESLRGSLDTDTRACLVIAFAEPGQESWERAHSVVISGHGPWQSIYSDSVDLPFNDTYTLWQAVCATDSDFPHKRPEDGQWRETPSLETLHAAVMQLCLKLAPESPQAGDGFN